MTIDWANFTPWASLSGGILLGEQHQQAGADGRLRGEDQARGHDGGGAFGCGAERGSWGWACG